MVSYLVTAYLSRPWEIKTASTFPLDPLEQMAKAPSSALLSVLAILATAGASPTPLAFLCPDSYNKRHFSNPTTAPPSPSLRIADKFVQGEDGLWRRAESYSLYGSTFSCTGVSYHIPGTHAAPSFPQVLSTFYTGSLSQ